MKKSEIEALGNEELMQRFEYVQTLYFKKEYTSDNGAPKKLCKECDDIRDEILRRMK